MLNRSVMLHFKSKVVFIVLSVFLALSVQGATTGLGKINVHRLSLEDDSHSDLSNTVLRDKDGFLWVGTDNGLKRYDGYRLRSFVYNPDDPQSIGTNTIATLMLQRSGSLWIGGHMLSLYHPETETFTNYNVSDGASIWAIHEDEQGVIWVGGEGFGLRGFDIADGRLSHQFFTEPDERFINTIVPHGISSSLWIASSAGLYLFNTRTFEIERYTIPANIEAGVDSIRGVAVARDGSVWVATLEGVVVLNPKTRQAKLYVAGPEEGALKSNTIWSVFEDSKGQMWLGTDKQGVHKYLPESDSFLHVPASTVDEFSFPPGAVQDIYEDDEGSLWFSVSHFGVRRISEHLEKFIALKHNEKAHNSLGFNNVLDLLEAKDGGIWIATDGGGLDYYDPSTQSFSHYRHDPHNSKSIASNSVISLAEDSQGSIWVGTWSGGLNRLDPHTGEFTQYARPLADGSKSGIANSNIFRVEIDEQNLMYLSVWRRGMQTVDINTGVVTSFFPGGEGSESGVSNYSINDFEMSASGKVWVGGHSGLERFDPDLNTFESVKLPNVEGIFDLYEDANRILWIASSHGLIRYDYERGEHHFFHMRHGLADNFVTSIEADDNGYLWLGTRGGLNRFDLSNWSFETYDERDGLAGRQFNRYSHLKARDGLMYFGGAQGLSVFNPNHLPKNTFPPRVHIIDLELFQMPVKPGETAYLTRHINHSSKLELPFHQRDITFEFAALNFISPMKNQYRFRLVGLEQDWKLADSTRRRVRYTNLAPGHYYFQVQGSNNEGVWSQNVKGVNLIVLAPWWQAWWARSMVVFLALALMYAFSYWRLRLNRRRERELQVLVGEKTNELEQASASVRKLNTDLEDRVERRTRELSVEIEERRLAEAKLFHMAFHDSLTGLPSRAWLLQHLELLIERAMVEKLRFGLFFMDGDRFKKVNDTHGHILGDMLLVAAAQRLQDVLPEGYHPVRLGGDEFTVVVDHFRSESELTGISQSIVTAFDRPFLIEQSQMFFRVSIGIVVCEQQYTKSEQILRDADIAMYRAKEKGRGTYQIFDAQMRESTLEMAALEADLYQALENKQLYVVYQPIVALNNGELSGFEVLLRWNHPQRGLVPPDKFIPVAEESGLIFEIGLWVLEQACMQLQAWAALSESLALPSIAVNLSPHQLAQRDLIERFDRILEKTGVHSQFLKLEITETALMENTDNVNQLLGALRDRDIELAIDDFGTGYSSLSYLDQLPVQVLKIDRKFVGGLINEEDDNGGAHEIVRATISLAHNLNIRVVAEGIETQEQWDALAGYRCDYGQGYYMARPMAAKAATEYLLKARR